MYQIVNQWNDAILDEMDKGIPTQWDRGIEGRWKTKWGDAIDSVASH